MKEAVQLGLSELADQQVSLGGLSIALAYQGITNFATTQPVTPSSFAERLIKDEADPSPLLIVTMEQEDLDSFNHVAAQFEDNKKTLVLWLGVTEKPKQTVLPVISMKQIERCPEVLDWENLCRLATKEETPLRKNFWQKMRSFLGPR